MVSAADNNTLDEKTVTDNLNTNSIETQTTSTQEINTKTESFTSLNDKIGESRENYIKLTEDYRFNASTDSGHVNGITIDKDNMVLDGCGHTIDGNHEARIFNITGENVLLKNIKIINGLSTNGAAIYSSQSINIIQCHFENNTAKANGGAVFIENDERKCQINSTFINNDANNGGAIYFNQQTDNIIIDGTYKYNTATRAGGAIYFKGSSHNNTFLGEYYDNRALEASGGAMFFHKITTNNNFQSIYRNNQAVYGAGIFFYNITNENTYNSDFRNNLAQSCGAAMFFHNTTEYNIFNGYFINNTAKTGNGGSITFKDTSKNNMFNCDFINNTAIYGGAVNYRVTPYNITFNTNFINNTAQYGGGINFFENMTNVTIKGHFKNNNAEYGGGICLDTGDVINTSFINNRATYGGAIYANKITIKNTQLINNTATKEGGATYINKQVNLYDSTLINNTSEKKDTIYINTTNETSHLTGNKFVKTVRYNTRNTWKEFITANTTPEMSNNQFIINNIKERKQNTPKNVHKMISQQKNNHKPTLNAKKEKTYKIISQKKTLKTKQITLHNLENIFNQNFKNGILYVYLDGKLIFNDTTTNDETRVILEIMDNLIGQHKLKIEFTKNNKTESLEEELIIET